MSCGGDGNEVSLYRRKRITRNGFFADYFSKQKKIKRILLI